MARELSPNRWNWSQEDNQWVFIRIDGDGNKQFYFQKEPPEEFNKLILQIKVLNDKLLLCKSSKRNEKIFNKMIKISRRMQSMELK